MRAAGMAVVVALTAFASADVASAWSFKFKPSFRPHAPVPHSAPAQHYMPTPDYTPAPRPAPDVAPSPRPAEPAPRGADPEPSESGRYMSPRFGGRGASTESGDVEAENAERSRSTEVIYLELIAKTCPKAWEGDLAPVDPRAVVMTYGPSRGTRMICALTRDNPAKSC